MGLPPISAAELAELDVAARQGPALAKTIHKGEERVSDVARITGEDAREYSESLAQIGDGWWRQIAWAYRQGIPEALGMSRREWAERYHGYLRMPIPERREAVAELSEAGMNNSAIADTLGVTEMTVRRDLHDSTNVESCDSHEPYLPAGDVADDVGSTFVESDSDEPFGMESQDFQRDTLPQVSYPDDDDDEPEAAEPSKPDLDEPQATAVELPAVQVNEGDEWYTPRWLFDGLGVTFSIDVCSPLDRTHTAVPAERWFTANDDGLAQPWDGTVWCNPPYSKPEPWARRMIHHGDGLLLTHMPMNAGWCVDAWDTCDAIRLFQAMEFVRPDGSKQRPGYWLQLTAFGPVATEALARLQPLGDAAFNKRRVASPMWRAA